MKDYKKQAIDFLKKTNTTLKIEKATPQKAPLWEKKGDKHGINYTCTLENKNHKYTFDFWDSIRDREIIEAIQNLKTRSQEDTESIQAERILLKEGFKHEEINKIRFQEKKDRNITEYEPKEYDIIACLNQLYEDNFEDFCASYGYDTDSIQALKTFEAVKEEDRNLRKLFDRSELEALSEIQ